jgi:pyruvate dehydrogenase E2 component (dihydrolipoamide acetyltransferase)
VIDVAKTLAQAAASARSEFKLENQMATEIYLVKVGMTMTEGMVEEWYVQDGGTVQQGELLYRLETEKVNLDVDADASGIVKHGVAVGVTMQPGVIGHIYAPGEAVPSAAPSGTSTAAPAAALIASRPAVAAPAPMHQAVACRRRRPRAGSPAKSTSISQRYAAPVSGRIVEADVRTAAASASLHRHQPPRPDRPLAKRLAAELGVDLARVTGT